MGSYKEIPPDFNKSLVLSNIHLRWNQEARSYIYHGPVAVIRAGNTQINKNVETYLKLTKRSSGDLLDLYFQVHGESWYYFGYTPGSFQVVSSNKEFNEIVLQLKDNVRKMKVGSGQPGFIYALAPDRRVQLFLRSFFEMEDAEKQNR